MVSTTPATAITTQSKLSFGVKRSAQEAGITMPEAKFEKRAKTDLTSGPLPTGPAGNTDLKSLLESYTLKEASPKLFDKISD